MRSIVNFESRLSYIQRLPRRSPELTIGVPEDSPLLFTVTSARDITRATDSFGQGYIYRWLIYHFLHSRPHSDVSIPPFRGLYVIKDYLNAPRVILTCRVKSVEKVIAIHAEVNDTEGIGILGISFAYARSSLVTALK